MAYTSSVAKMVTWQVISMQGNKIQIETIVKTIIIMEMIIATRKVIELK